jgi:hypothetical protein
VRHDELDHAWKVGAPVLHVKAIRGEHDAHSAFIPSFLPCSIDLYPHLALDRRPGRSTSQALAVSLWFTRSQGDGRLHPQVLLQAVNGGVVSLPPPTPLLFFRVPLRSCFNKCRMRSVWPTTELANL